MHLRRAAATLALCLPACGGAPAAPPPVVSATRTPQALQPLGLPEVQAKPLARTTVPVPFAVDRASVEEFVEQFLPKRYGERGRAVGHGVKLDVDVTRGTPTYEAKGDALELSLPLALSLDVHRRLGPINLALGHCEPPLLAKVRLFPLLSPELTVRTPEVELTLKQRCSFSGFDVSAIIEDELGQQQRRALGELDKALKVLPLLLTTQVKRFETPLARADGRCPHLRVEHVLQSPLIETDNVLTMTLGVEGAIVDNCDPELSSQLSVEQRSSPIRFEVVTQSLITWEALSRALDPILSKHGFVDSPLRLTSAQTPQGERIALGLSSQRATGWVLLEPQIEGTQLRLVARESNDHTLLAQLQPLLVQLSIPLALTEHAANARKLFELARPLSQVHLSAPRTKARLTVTTEQLSTKARPQLDPNGINVVFSTEGP